MEDNNNINIKEKSQKEKTQNTIAIIFLIIICILFCKFLSNDKTSHTSNNGKPDNVELMSYAQTVLKDNLSNPKYSSYKGDYTFIETGLRYKIEGNVTVNNSNNKFYMIIEFDDNTYKDYTLISLQVGDKIIYKK